AAELYTRHLATLDTDGTPPEARALAVRARALLATGDDADRWFREALRFHDESRLPLSHGRTALLYGEDLPRDNRPAPPPVPLPRGGPASGAPPGRRPGPAPGGRPPPPPARAPSAASPRRTPAPRGRSPGGPPPASPPPASSSVRARSSTT